MEKYLISCLTSELLRDHVRTPAPFSRIGLHGLTFRRSQTKFAITASVQLNAAYGLNKRPPVSLHL